MSRKGKRDTDNFGNSFLKRYSAFVMNEGYPMVYMFSGADVNDCISEIFCVFQSIRLFSLSQ